MTLRADVGRRLGPIDLQVQMVVDDGETLAVLGPNGAGKTTLLRTLSGLLPLDRGTIEIDGVTVDEPEAGVFVEPARRSVGVVFQEYLLFPHLSVLENVAFGLRSRGVARKAARARATAWLARVGLADRAGDKPTQLSGGQGQRVALARALAPEPRLLLLDEPLAALDIGTRIELRRDLRAHLASFEGARVLVTHELLDAVALADRIVVLEEGRVAQQGTIPDVAARPRSRYVADLVGVNLLRGQARDDEVALTGGGVLTVAEPASGDVYVAVQPNAVAVHRAATGGQPPQRVAGTRPRHRPPRRPRTDPC